MACSASSWATWVSSHLTRACTGMACSASSWATWVSSYYGVYRLACSASSWMYAWVDVSVDGFEHGRIWAWTKVDIDTCEHGVPDPVTANERGRAAQGYAAPESGARQHMPWCAYAFIITYTHSHTLADIHREVL
eukprot:1137474-Pelagomonas_calceolata.AAC.10